MSWASCIPVVAATPASSSSSSSRPSPVPRLPDRSAFLLLAYHGALVGVGASHLGGVREAECAVYAEAVWWCRAACSIVWPCVWGSLGVQPCASLGWPGGLLAAVYGHGSLSGCVGRCLSRAWCHRVDREGVREACSARQRRGAGRYAGVGAGGCGRCVAPHAAIHPSHSAHGLHPTRAALLVAGWYQATRTRVA